MNWDTIRDRCESTPFTTIQMPNARVDLYWSKNSGTYGYQVYSFAINHDTNETKFDKSGGCGYCKESQETQIAFAWLGTMPRDYKPGAEGIPHQYRVGGNFYKVPKKDVLKYKG